MHSFCVVIVALVIGYTALYIPLMALDSATSTFFTCWFVDRV